jgi:gliding motility-associated-like protein
MKSSSVFLLSFLFAFSLFHSEVRAQSITNAGTDFWFGFTEPLDAFKINTIPADTTIVFQANISSSNATSGFIEIPGTTFLVNFNVNPGSVTKVVIPDSLAYIGTSEVIEPRAIHVHTEDDCVLYSNTFHQFRSEASLVLPNRALGEEYFVITAYPIMLNTGWAGNFYPGPWRSEFMVVAPGEQVTVEITPSDNTLGGNLAGVPFTVTIDSGELYQVQGDSMEDLTGSRVRVTSANGTVAVFAGNVWSQIFCGTTADPLYEAQFPVSSWGREYIMLPTPEVGTDMFRVVAQEDDTDIFKDGTLLTTIDAGEFYQDTHQVARLISSNNPISVGQFMVSNGGGTCSNIIPGDPSMVMINPNEQMFLDSITFFAVSEVAISLNYVVIAIRTADTATLELDGAQVVGFETLNADTNYSYTKVLIDTGSHTLNTGGCGFLAYSIGLGNAESYSYAAGVRLTNLDGGVDYSNITVNSDTICQYDSLRFQVSATGNPETYAWDLGDGTLSSASNPIYSYDSGGTYFISVSIVSQCGEDTIHDTITVVPLPIVELGVDTTVCLSDSVSIMADSALSYLWGGGETTQSISVDSTDTYFVTISNTRCASSDSIQIVFEKTINGLAVSSLDTTDTVCDGEPLQFNGFTSRKVEAWLWTFGDGASDTAQNTVHTYQTGGNYTVELLATYLCDQDSISDLFTYSVQINQTPEFDLGSDTFACAELLTLKAGEDDNAGYDYYWLPNEEEEFEITITEPGVYYVTVNNDGCFSTDSVEVFFSEDFVIPNVFTPNNDGVNDFFRIDGTPECHDFDELSVYNRWGMLVYYSTNPMNHAWYGFSEAGEPLPSGVYFFQLSGDDGIVNGSMTLLRE